MKIIKKKMAYEEYINKYPHFNTSLISFSDNEIKEFNTRFYKLNKKNIPNKFALLDKYKWIHIKDKYYQIPRIGSYKWFINLNKLAKALVCAGTIIVLGSAITFPVIFTQYVSLNAEEFSHALSYITTNSEHRKYLAKGTSKSYNSVETVTDTNLLIEVEGNYIKVEHDEAGEKYNTYQNYFNNNLYEYMSSTNTWKKNPKGVGTAIDDTFRMYSFYSNNYSSFKKINLNTYKASELTFELNDSNNEIKFLITSTVEFTFNIDKTIKSVKEKYKTTIDSNVEESILTSETNLEFFNVGFHKIDNKIGFVNPTEVNHALQYDQTNDIYKTYIETLSKDVDEIFTIKIQSSEGKGKVNRFYIDLDDTREIIPITPDMLTIKVNDTETTDYTIENNIIKFNNTYETNDDVITIKLNIDVDYEYLTAHAYYSN